MSSLQEVKAGLNRARMLGEQLASDAKRVLFRGEGVTYTMGDLLEGIEDNNIRRNTAVLLENTRDYFQNLDETTKLVNVGSFEKFAFPLVRVVMPSLVSNELVSVQPMQGPTSLVFYLKFLYDNSKGTAVAGTDMFQNPNRHYSSEEIDSENIGSGDGATVAFTPTLAYTPVKPGTVRITATISAAEVEVVDDGNGALTGASLASAGTIDYTTGATSFTFSTAPDNATDILCDYSYELEANTQIPRVNLSLTSTPVQAKKRTLGANWSLEASADYKTLHGVDAEMDLLAGMTSELKFEIDREVVEDLKRLASNTIATAWSATAPSGVSVTEHRLSLVYEFVKASNEIYSTTGRAEGTWIVAGKNVVNHIEALPGFVPSGQSLVGLRGVYKSGTLNNRWTIFKDANYSDDAYLVGYRGVNMMETGYIYAPYIPFYTIPTYALDDMVGRKAIASRYGKKMVDGGFYCTGTVTT